MLLHKLVDFQLDSSVSHLLDSVCVALTMQENVVRLIITEAFAVISIPLHKPVVQFVCSQRITGLVGSITYRIEIIRTRSLILDEEKQCLDEC